MLAIVDAVAVAQFSSGQQIRVAAAGHGQRLGAEHHPGSRDARAGAPARHPHEPVGAVDLVRAAMLGCELLQVADEPVAHHHRAPRAQLTVVGEHRRGDWRPTRAGGVASVEQGHVVFGVPGMLVCRRLGRLFVLVSLRLLVLARGCRRLFLPPGVLRACGQGPAAQDGQGENCRSKRLCSKDGFHSLSGTATGRGSGDRAAGPGLSDSQNAPRALAGSEGRSASWTPWPAGGIRCGGVSLPGLGATQVARALAVERMGRPMASAPRAPDRPVCIPGRRPPTDGPASLPRRTSCTRGAMAVQRSRPPQREPGRRHQTTGRRSHGRRARRPGAGDPCVHGWPGWPRRDRCVRPGSGRHTRAPGLE